SPWQQQARRSRRPLWRLPRPRNLGALSQGRGIRPAHALLPSPRTATRGAAVACVRRAKAAHVIVGRRSVDRRLEQAAELAREIDRYACVHGALLVEEALRAARCEDAFVPDVRMDVEAVAAVEAEADEVGRLDVVAGEREGHEERFALEWEKELAAIGMVVRMPEQNPLRIAAVICVG